jgi:hypothetical protein
MADVSCSPAQAGVQLTGEGLEIWAPAFAGEQSVAHEACHD